MKIGQVADASGVPIRTIRFYEGQGLLRTPTRTAGGYRIFDERDLERLDFIRKAKRLGLSLPEIAEILAVTDRGEPTCEHVRALLGAKLRELDHAISELAELRAGISSLLEQAGPVQDCRPTGGRVCAFIEQAPALAEASGMQRAGRNAGKGA